MRIYQASLVNDVTLFVVSRQCCLCSAGASSLRMDRPVKEWGGRMRGVWAILAYLPTGNRQISAQGPARQTATSQMRRAFSCCNTRYTRPNKHCICDSSNRFGDFHIFWGPLNLKKWVIRKYLSIHCQSSSVWTTEHIFTRLHQTCILGHLYEQGMIKNMF